MPSEKVLKRKRRHLRIRKKISGTAERPRLCVHKSLKHMRAQLVDDEAGRSLLQVSSSSKAFKEAATSKNYCNIESAKRLGKMISEKAREAGIKSAVFDRGGFLYHGCVKAFAEAAREGGLKL